MWHCTTAASGVLALCAARVRGRAVLPQERGRRMPPVRRALFHLAGRHRCAPCTHPPTHLPFPLPTLAPPNLAPAQPLPPIPVPFSRAPRACCAGRRRVSLSPRCALIAPSPVPRCAPSPLLVAPLRTATRLSAGAASARSSFSSRAQRCSALAGGIASGAASTWTATARKTAACSAADRFCSTSTGCTHSTRCTRRSACVST